VPEIASVLRAVAADGLGLRPAPVPAEPDRDAPAQRFLASVREGGPAAAMRMVADLLEREQSVRDVYLGVLEPAQHEIGRLWQTNRLSVAEEHYVTATTQLVMAQLYPRVFVEPPTRPCVVVACVAAELHEIGARMVADLLQIAGFDTQFVGANVPVQDLVRFIADCDAQAVGLSATIGAHLGRVEDTIRAIRANARTAGVKVVVGGYPFCRIDTLWQRVGADACAANARDAVDTFTRLLHSG
jgi:methylmalonyl-CoA mutase cobalamin-binding domain/chain